MNTQAHTHALLSSFRILHKTALQLQSLTCGRYHQKEVNGEEHSYRPPLFPAPCGRVAVHSWRLPGGGSPLGGEPQDRVGGRPLGGCLKNAGEPGPVWVEQQVSCASLPSVAGLVCLGCGFGSFSTCSP